MTRSVTLAKYLSMEEGMVVTSLLRSADFHVTNDDYWFTSINWDLTIALGGVRVTLPQNELDELEAFIADLNTEPTGEQHTDDDEPPLTRSARDRIKAAFLFSGLASIAEPGGILGAFLVAAIMLLGPGGSPLVVACAALLGPVIIGALWCATTPSPPPSQDWSAIDDV